ncbi:MAG: hypothetical protein Kow0059_12070 [Candidatus Sumerlaeia bacterium]
MSASRITARTVPAGTGAELEAAPAAAPLRFREPPGVTIPADAALHFEPEMKYECVQCGFGCRTMEVQLDRPSWETIRALPLERVSLRLRHAPGVFSTSPSAGVCCLRQVEGRCVFLEPGNLCALHRVFGYESKPQSCRDFPFRLTVAPDGVWVGLSFACTAVLQEQGPPVQSHEPLLRVQLGASLSVQRAGDEQGRVALSDTQALSWEQYRRLEGLLVELIDRRDVCVDDALRAGAIVLRLLSDFLVQGRSGGGFTPEQIFDHFLDRMRAESLAMPLRLARKPVGGAAQKRVFLGTLIHFRNAVARRPSAPPAAAWALGAQYVRHLLKAGRFEMLPLPGRLPWWALERTRADWDEPFFEYQRRRFLRHQVFRKDLVAYYPVATAWALLMAQHALVKWFALARAHLRGSLEVGREDLMEALRCVETHYSHHFTFHQLFERMPLLWAFLERLLNHRRYPYIITAPP